MIAAAGHGLRMGFPKALMSINGKAVLEKILDNFSRAQIKSVYITLPEYLLSNLKYLPANLRINKYDYLGYSGSVRSILEEIENNYDGIIITPVDSCFININLINLINIYANYLPGSQIILPEYYFMAGHPVYISKNFFLDLKTCYKFGGLRGLIARNARFVKRISWEDKKILTNLNYLSDANFWKAQNKFGALAGSGYAFDIATKAIHGHFAVSQTHARAKFSA